MSTAISTDEQPITAKQPRVLACVACQQRKIKCNRKFPCANCVRAGALCVPATLALRRRRFPERELLDRLRHYEDLLRQNNIQFEPLHGNAAEIASPTEDVPDLNSAERGRQDEPDLDPAPNKERNTARSGSVNIWHAMTLKARKNGDSSDEDDESDSGYLHESNGVRGAVIKKAWDHMYESENNDHLLFGSPRTNIDLSTLHPGQAQIFRLWQIYLENVNPLLKVTHTPTWQSRIIDAVTDLSSISPATESLLFSIYCISIVSLTDEECRASFGSPRKDLLANYQFGCRQALLNCRVLRTSDLDCLTAFYLYLVSVRPETDPRSLASMLGVAIRIAQRMGLDRESTYSRCAALEGEMRRRLWWSLVLFDHRVCEMFDYKSATLGPTWDCRTLLNVNDFEIQPEMKIPPAIHETPTEAVFTVVRSELGDFLRQSDFHLVISDSTLKKKEKMSRVVSEEGKLDVLANRMEDRYLAFCNPEIPLHYMTIWMTRGQLAKYRLLQHYSTYSVSSVPQTESQRNIALSYGLTILDCDTKLMASRLTKGYLWLIQFYFPFPAYIHILQDISKGQTLDRATRAWEVMSENFEARFKNVKRAEWPFFIVFSRLVLQAWKSHEESFQQSNKPLAQPHIVSDIKNTLMDMIANFRPSDNATQPDHDVGSKLDEFLMPMPMDLSASSINGGTVGSELPSLGVWNYPDPSGTGLTGFDMAQFDWTMDWNLMNSGGF